MVKILGMNASPRGEQSQTLRLVRAVLKGAAEEGAETELVDIYRLKIDYCTACGVCYAEGECTLIDDFPDLMEKMLDAEGIVLGSPNYIDSVTAPMKAVFDRMADAIHRQLFSGKYGCAVCTAGGSGQEKVVDYMNHVIIALGGTAVGGVGIAIGRDPNAILKGEEDARELGKRLVQSIRGEHRYPEQEEIHRQRMEYFTQLVKYNKDRWPFEYEWWARQGVIRES